MSEAKKKELIKARNTAVVNYLATQETIKNVTSLFNDIGIEYNTWRRFREGGLVTVDTIYKIAEFLKADPKDLI